jgi:Tripartite tricarboxylate transporter family receptor
MVKTRNIGNAACSQAVTIGGSTRGSIRALIVGVLLSAASYATQSYAQEWPQRTVRLILPFGPASAADTTARVMSDPLAARWGKSVIVENKPGADGLLAISAFLGAKDDHALLLTSTGSFLAHPYVHKKLDYNFERDFAPIARNSRYASHCGRARNVESRGPCAIRRAGARAAGAQPGGLARSDGIRGRCLSQGGKPEHSFSRRKT